MIEVARMLGVSRQTIYRQIATGGLRATTVGEKTRVTVGALDDYLGEGAQEWNSRQRGNASGC